uniref:Uncharacterized protein n=1 Tax=Chenopodium quinoa TaxID=63459 RepID=A0A803N667_CHEQI
MDLPPTQVIMPFRPLLKQITSYLNFPDPDYQFVDEPGSIACVVIKIDCGPIASVYIGGYTESVEEPYEVAARNVVYDFMKKYEIVIEDVTYLRKQMYDRCGQLFWFKKEELERIEREEPKICIHEEVSYELESNHKKIVVDFIVILRAIFRTVDIRCTPIETIEHSPDQLTSWFTIMPHKEGVGFRFDANYKVTTTRFDAILCTLERESYVGVKERVLGIKEQLELSTALIEQDCLTPLGKKIQVTVSIPPLLPHKKRLLRHIYAEIAPVLGSDCEMVSMFPLPDDFDCCLKRGKFVRVDQLLESQLSACANTTLVVAWCLVQSYSDMNRLLQEPSSSNGYRTKRLKSLESGSQDELQRAQAEPSIKRAKIPKTRHPVTKSPHILVTARRDGLQENSAENDSAEDHSSYSESSKGLQIGGENTLPKVAVLSVLAIVMA